MARRAWHCRAFLANGHTVLLRHMLRGAPSPCLDALLREGAPAWVPPAQAASHARAERLLASLLADYETIAATLGPLPWRSQGPVLGHGSVDVRLIPGRG